MVKKFLPIILLTFVNVIGFSILIPVLPSVAEKYAPVYAEPVYGILLSAYAFFQFLGAPILGSLSDKYGRKPLLILSQAGTTLSWVIFGIAYFVPSINILGTALPLLIIAFSRIIDGVTGGNISVAQAWVSDMTTREEKTKAFGLIGAIFGLGFLFGPAIGGFSSATSYGYLGTVIVAFLISLSTLGYMYFFLPESLEESKRDKELHIEFFKEINILHKLSVFKGNQFMRDLIKIRFAFMLVVGGFLPLIILHMQEAFSLSESGLGLTLSIIGFFSIFNQAVLAPKLSKKIGNTNTFYLSIASFTLALATIPLLPTKIIIFGIPLGLALFMFNAYFINIGFSLGSPTFKSIIVNNVSEKQQGLATGIDESLVAFGNFSTPVLAGLLYGVIGKSSFYVFASLLVLPFIYFLIFRGKLLPQQS